MDCIEGEEKLCSCGVKCILRLMCPYTGLLDVDVPGGGYCDGIEVCTWGFVG